MNSLRVKIATKGAEVNRPAQGAVKALKAFEDYADSNLRVLGVPFGGPIKGRDADGEAFHEQTNIWLKVGDTVPMTYYHGFGPDSPDDMQPDPVMIGRAKYLGAGKRGHWFEARFDESEPLAQRILADPLKARASSGAVGHLVRMGKGGLIDIWPVGELAVFDTNDWRLPANDFAVIEAKTNTEAALEADEAKSAAVIGIQAENIIVDPLEGKMDENEVKAETSQPQPDLAALIEAAVEKALKAQPATEKGGLVAPSVIKSRGERSPKEAFLHYCRTGERMKAAMQEGTAEEGGYLVPDDMLPQIIAKRDEGSIARLAGARIITTSRDVVQVPYENTSHTAFAITAEEAAISEGEPTIGQVSITVYRFTKLVKVSEQLLEDDATNLEAFLADSFGRAWAGTENSYVCTGSGSGQPQGITYGGTAGLTFADTNSITAAEIVELQHKLGSAYANESVWIMRNATLGHLRALSGNPFYFQPTPAGNLMAGSAGELLGKPVFLSDAVAAIATGAKTVYFGNMNFYGLAERKGLSIRRLNELYAGNGQVGFLASVRFGGAVLQSEAFQYGTQT